MEQYLSPSPGPGSVTHECLSVSQLDVPVIAITFNDLLRGEDLDTSQSGVFDLLSLNSSASADEDDDGDDHSDGSLSLDPQSLASSPTGAPPDTSVFSPLRPPSLPTGPLTASARRQFLDAETAALSSQRLQDLSSSAVLSTLLPYLALPAKPPPLRPPPFDPRPLLKRAIRQWGHKHLYWGFLRWLKVTFMLKPPPPLPPAFVRGEGREVPSDPVSALTTALSVIDVLVLENSLLSHSLKSLSLQTHAVKSVLDQFAANGGRPRSTASPLRPLGSVGPASYSASSSSSPDASPKMSARAAALLPRVATLRAAATAQGGEKRETAAGNVGNKQLRKGPGKKKRGSPQSAAWGKGSV